MSTSGEHPISPAGAIYTTDQIAAILQVHRRTIERLIARGALQAMHVGRRLRVTTQQLEAFIARQGGRPHETAHETTSAEPSSTGDPT
jgi:excisionase family DNA binding protein